MAAPAFNLVLLHEGSYKPSPIEKGYANNTLHIDLTKRSFTVKPVNEEMKHIFTGGKGFDLKLLWDSVPPKCSWDDPMNEVKLFS